MNVPYEIFVHIMEYANPKDIVSYQKAYPNDDKSYDNHLWYNAYKYQYVNGFTDVVYDKSIIYFEKYYAISSIDICIDQFTDRFKGMTFISTINRYLIFLTIHNIVTLYQHKCICEYFYMINLPLEQYENYGRINYCTRKYKSVHDAVQDLTCFRFVRGPETLDLADYYTGDILKLAKSIGLGIRFNTADYIKRKIIEHLILTHRLFIFPISYDGTEKQYFRYEM